jgi:membrane AbrB-like protein
LPGQVLHDGAVGALVRGLVVHLAEQHHVGLHQVLHARRDGASGAHAASVNATQAAAARRLFRFLVACIDTKRLPLFRWRRGLRLVVVTVTIPFAMQWSGLQGLEINPPGVREVNAGGLALLALATGIGGLAMRALGRTNPWFIGPLLVAMGFTIAGQSLSAVPTWMSNAAQLVIAVSLGVRFSREFLHTAPRWLGSVALGTFAMLVLCGGVAWLLARATGLHPATMLLSTSPGGIAEMAITAKVLQLGVPVVTAFQVCRLVAVLLLVGPMFRWIYLRSKTARP